MTQAADSLLSRLLWRVAKVEPLETRAVFVAFVYFFFLMASYFILRPLRDTMGTIYGVAHLQELFTGTFIVSFIVAPIYAGFASRIRLSTFLPWVYGFIALTMAAFYGLFETVPNNRGVAAAFYVWLSTFNLLTISVFWSMMADIFSKPQAKRLFGFVAAGFVITGVLVRVLENEKRKFAVADGEAQKTSLDKRLGGNPFDGFILLFRSRYLLMIALFLLLMTWISTVIYFQLSDTISHEFATKAARTRAFATIDLAVNSAAVLIQLFGTGRFLQRFGVTAGLLLNPVIMVIAFLAVALSPALMVLGGVQVVRRVAEYAVAKPSRDMLFTAVDQQAKYKAKNVIDTVVYRFGDLTSAWLSALILPFGVAGLAVFGAVVSVFWFPIGYFLGKRYESERSGEIIGGAP